MNSPSEVHTPLYQLALVARGYDALNALLWLPTGSDRLRRQFVDTIDLQATDRVLEFGCGTGLVTRHLCATGATVTAVDRSPAMLAAPRRRAAAATFVTDDVLGSALDGPFDRVVLSFVLHELDPIRRRTLLQRAAALLSPTGWIAILEWARPAGAVQRRVWTLVVQAIEPKVAHDVLVDGIDTAIAGADLTIVGDRTHVGGRARSIRVEAALTVHPTATLRAGAHE